MECIIIDDETTARAIIHRLISNHAQLHLQEEFSNAMQAIKYLNQNTIDLIFLDIHMPDFTGIDFIQSLKNPPMVILTTSDKSFASEAFEYDFIVDYLVKPIAKERFDKAILKASGSRPLPSLLPTESEPEEAESGILYININRRLIKIDISSIYLVAAKGDYIQIKTHDQNYLVHSTLKKIENKLPDDQFLKIHRSFIINTKFIIDIQDNSVLIEKDVIPVSRSNRPELMKRVNLL
ncbi:LytR/AlgR family response regulator transcription factor [Christiangramia aquimixticola]|uniref:LytR/AlgR family response regulator transcription factor n=1 Tax=Christiangramia aquimixticola TaxID=1697558 RepID=UPI003AA9138B